MSVFEDRIYKYPHIWKTYKDSMETIESSPKNGMMSYSDMDYFMSKNCRVWFFEKHLMVEREASDQELRSIDQSPIVQFYLSDIQLKQLDNFEKRIALQKKFRVRVMKCRRAKMSTIYLAILYQIARFNENKKFLVFADRLETSRKLRRILDIFHQNDDLVNKPEIGKKTLAEGLYLHQPGSDRTITDKDSFILLGSTEQKNSGLGGSLDGLLWSEAALSSDATTHWTTISPSLQGALFDIAESTPSLTGQDEIIFPEFEKPSENCDRFFVSWKDVAEYRIDDEVKEKDFIAFEDHSLYGKEKSIMEEFKTTVPQMLWRRFKLDELKNANAFKQVFPISIEEAFYSSAGLFFHNNMIEMTKPKEKKEGHLHSLSDQGAGVISLVPSQTGNWRVYDKASHYNNYLISVDIAEGRCADRDNRDPDYSVAIVWKIGFPTSEAAIFRDRLPPEIFAEQVATMAKYYNNALVIPEKNGPGLAFIVRLMQLYSNIYRNQMMKAGTFVLTDDYGFSTTSPMKLHALSCLLAMIRDKGRGLILHSDVIRTEMSKFAQMGVKYGAMPGHHDDTITCLWLMAICISQTPSLSTPKDLNSDFSRQTNGNHGLFVPKIERDNDFQHSMF